MMGHSVYAISAATRLVRQGWTPCHMRVSVEVVSVTRPKSKQPEDIEDNGLPVPPTNWLSISQFVGLGGLNMFSSQGLESWELLFVSGMLAMGMLAISTLIGWTVAYVVLREPGTAVSVATRADAVPVATIPQCSECMAEPGYGGKSRGLAVSSR
jgi:hypothetical protein